MVWIVFESLQIVSDCLRTVSDHFPIVLDDSTQLKQKINWPRLGPTRRPSRPGRRADPSRPAPTRATCFEKAFFVKDNKTKTNEQKCKLKEKQTNFVNELPNTNK